ncbi:S8 family serine peptidase [Lacunimicrobium album]
MQNRTVRESFFSLFSYQWLSRFFCKHRIAPRRRAHRYAENRLATLEVRVLLSAATSDSDYLNGLSGEALQAYQNTVATGQPIYWGESGYVSSGRGSTIYNGLNINDFLGADRFYAAGFTGTRAVVGNVEAGHAWSGHETLTNLSGQIHNTSITGTQLGQVDRHATWVSQIIGGDTNADLPYQIGMAPDAELYSGAIATSWSGTPYRTSFSFTDQSFLFPYRQLMLDGVGSEFVTADVINSSWGGGGDYYGTQTTSRLIDALANLTGTSVVFSAGNSGFGSDTVSGPAAGFNTISVGALGPDTGNNPYSTVSSFSSGGVLGSIFIPTVRQPTGPFSNQGILIPLVRPMVDILAPGEDQTAAFYGGATGGNIGGSSSTSTTAYTSDLQGTSFAAPTVAGGLALMVDAARGTFGDTTIGTDARVLQAVLQSSADKTTGWSNAQSLADGVITTTSALDPLRGAGRMNLSEAYNVLLNGTSDLAGDIGGTIDSLGWDYGESVDGVFNDYFFDQVLTAGSTITSSLTWFADRTIDLLTNQSYEDSFDNLDLEIWKTEDGVATEKIAESKSRYSNVEHLNFEIPETGNYMMRVVWSGEVWDLVSDANSEQYAIAWNVDEESAGPEISVQDQSNNLIDALGTLNFGTALQNQPSYRALIVVNQGSENLILHSVDTTGNFEIVGQIPNDLVLAPQQATTILVKMQSNLPGSQDGSIRILSNDADEELFSVSLDGTVVGPEISVIVDSQPIASQTGVINFGTSNINDIVEKTVTVQNLGQLPLTLSPAQIVGEGFEIVSNFQQGQSVAVGGSVTLTIRMNTSIDRSLSAWLELPNSDTDEGLYRIQLLGVIDPPGGPEDILLSNDSVAENQPAGTVVGTLSTTDPTTGDTFTYQLISGTGSTHNSSFQIVGNELRTTVSFNYESTKTRSIRVLSTDSAGLSAEKTFTIQILDGPDSPTSIALSASTVVENQPAGTIIGLLSTNDPDVGDVFTYSLVSGTGSTHNSYFRIEGNQLQTNLPINYEEMNSASIRVRVVDSFGNAYETIYSITIRDVTDERDPLFVRSFLPPITQPQYSFVDGSSFTTSNSQYIVVGSPKSQIGTNIGSGMVSVYDAQTGELLRTIVNPTSAPFEYFGESVALKDNLLFVSTPDGGTFDAGLVYVYDLISGDLVWTISAPTSASLGHFGKSIAIAGDLIAIGEPGRNSGATHLYQISTRSFYRTFTNPGSSSSDDFGTLVALNSQYVAINTPGDDTGASSAGAVYLYDVTTGLLKGKITNPEPSSFDEFGTSLAISDTHVFIGTPDDDNPSSNSGSVYAFRLSDLSLTATLRNPEPVSSGDFGYSLDVDGHLLVIGAIGNRIGTTSVGAAYIYDTNSMTLLKKLVSPVSGSGAKFGSSVDIVGNRILVHALDDATVAYGVGATYEFLLPSPTNITIDNQAFNEDAQPGTLVGTLSAVELKYEGSFTYELIEGEGSQGNSQFQFIQNQLFTTATFDGQQNVTVRVKATNAFGLSVEQTLTFEIISNNSAPSDILLTSNTVAENLPPDTPVGSFTTTDPDAGNTHTYSLVAGTGSTDNAAFTIVGNQLLANASFDYETKSSYSIRVRTIDQGGLFFEKTFTISVTDIFEMPVGSTPLTNLRFGVAGNDNAFGSGYMMYSQQNVRTRFSGLDPNNADNFINVRLNGSQWQYDNNTTWVNFTPTSTDVLVAAIDFTTDTVTMLKGNFGVVNGISKGYLDGTLLVTANQWKGQTNAGEFGVSGTFISFAPSTPLTGLRNGVGGTDNATGTGYMMYSQQNVRTRFSGLDSNNADNFINVRLNGAQWQYDNNSTWVNFTPTSSDVLVAALNFTTDTVTLLEGNLGLVNGIVQGYLDGDLAIIANNWAGTTNAGEYRVTGTYITFAPRTPLTGLRNGIGGTDNATGTGYMMYSQSNVRTRFSGLDPNNADNFVNVRLNGSQWQYDNNSTWVNFVPTSSDRLVAALDFTADTVDLLKGTFSTIQGIASGYLDGDLTITPNNWNGNANTGEYHLTGTFITFMPTV